MVKAKAGDSTAIELIHLIMLHLQHTNAMASFQLHVIHEIADAQWQLNKHSGHQRWRRRCKLPAQPCGRVTASYRSLNLTTHRQQSPAAMLTATKAGLPAILRPRLTARATVQCRVRVSAAPSSRFAGSSAAAAADRRRHRLPTCGAGSIGPRGQQQSWPRCEWEGSYFASPRDMDGNSYKHPQGETVRMRQRPPPLGMRQNVLRLTAAAAAASSKAAPHMCSEGWRLSVVATPAAPSGQSYTHNCNRSHLPFCSALCGAWRRLACVRS